MGRTVSVGLRLEVAKYIEDEKLAEHATKDLKDEVKDLGVKSKVSSAEMAKTVPHIKHMGDESKKTAHTLANLNTHIEDTRKRVRSLAEEISRNPDDDVLLRKFGAEKSQLARLERVRNTLADIGENVRKVNRHSGHGGGGSGLDLIGALPSQVKGVAILGLVAAAVAAAPAIGAIVGGAVVSGIGAAGIGTGIALAFQDSRVTDAAGDLGARAKRAFVAASSGMIQPTIEALSIMGDAAEDVAREMGGMWSDLAPEVAPLAQAIGDMARSAMPGLRDAIEVAKPALRVLAKELPEIGEAFSDMFSTISDEGDGALLGLVALFDGVEATIRFTGEAIAWLSARWEELVRGFAEFSGNAEDVIGWMPFLGDAMRDTNDKTERWLAALEASKQPSETAKSSFGQVRRAVEDAGLAAMDAQKRFDTLFGQWMSLDEAAIRVEAAIDDVAESLKENGRTLDINTEKGRTNRQTLLDGVEAAEQHRQKMIENGQSVVYANGVYQETINRLYAQAIAAGVSRTELDKLLGKYRDLANTPDITKTIRIRFVTEGKAPPASRPGELIAFAKGGIHEPATGMVAAERGLITDSPMVLFGEGRGKEGFVPEQGISRQRALGLGSEVMAWHRASVVPWEQMGAASGGNVEVRVFVGNEEITNIVRTEVREHDRGVRRRAMAGTGRR